MQEKEDEKMTGNLSALLKYLEVHSNVHRLNPDEVHGDCLREIAENPALIGIRNPRHVFKDVALDENK